MPWSEPSPHSSMPGSGRECRRAGPRLDDPRRRTACAARPAPSARPVDGTDKISSPRTPDTRHCGAGSPGLGKSWIACALGHKACRDNRSVQYHRVPRLFEALALARGDGRYGRLLKSLGRVQLLILDDWGLSVLNPSERRDLLEILDDRHGRASTIVTSQIPVELWHDVIGDPTLGDAILDRLVHNAHRLQLSGESMRKQNARNQSLDANSNP